jgi:hypothetical protein
MSDELDNLTGLPWLVDARNVIQILILDLHWLYLQAPPPDDNPETIAWAHRWQLVVGTSFSLWRAVFLVDPDDIERPIVETAAIADKFLLRIITTNNVSFTDDYNNREWSGGYYMNNVRFRLERLRNTRFDFFESQTMRLTWNKYFRMVRQDVNANLPDYREGGA